MGERQGVNRRLHDDFVRADSSHAVENSIGAAGRVAFDTIERPNMGVDANLRLTVDRQMQQCGPVGTIAHAERARIGALLFAFRMTDDDPTSGNGVFAKFHSIAWMKKPELILYRTLCAAQNRTGFLRHNGVNPRLVSSIGLNLVYTARVSGSLRVCEQASKVGWKVRGRP